MQLENQSRIGRLALILFLIASTGSGIAHAAVEKEIINAGNSSTLGSISFPALSGTDKTGMLLDVSGFTDADITSVSWDLDPGTLAVTTLDLKAVMGDSPCSTALAPCSNTKLTLSPTSLSTRVSSCDNTLCHASITGRGIEFIDTAPTHSCVGFEPPLANGPVKVKKNRVLPLKAELFDADGFALGNGHLDAAPVVQVMYDSGTDGAPVDVSMDALPAGLGMDGNMFVFTGSQWQFNLKTRNYTAPGTYMVGLVSGDTAEYGVAPICVAEFVIE